MRINSKKSTITEKILLVNKKIEEISINSAIQNGDFREFYDKFDISSKKITKTDSVKMDSPRMNFLRKNSINIDTLRINSERKDSAKIDSAKINSSKSSPRKYSVRMDSPIKDFSKLRRSSTYQSNEYVEETSPIRLSQFAPSTNYNQELTPKSGVSTKIIME